MRYALLYTAHFFAFGCYAPYLSLYLGRDLGFSQAEIGWIMSVSGLVALSGPFIIGPFVERTSRRRAVMATCFALSAFVYPAYLLTDSFVLALVPTVLAGIVFLPLIPLVDDVTMHYVRSSGRDYGHIRLWGSISFIVASLFVGWLMDRASWAQFPVFTVSQLIAAAIILKFPRESVNYRTSQRKDLHFWRALSGPFVVFLIAGFVARLANVGHYAFFSLYLEDIGAPDSIKGIAWSVGVVAEIGMMIWAGRIIRRFGASRLFLLGLIGSAARYVVYVLFPTVPGALFGQLFHAFSFGAVHIGAVTLVAELAPEGRSGTGQMAYAALSMGLGTTVGSAIAGYMAGAWGYHGMYIGSSILALVAALVFRVFSQRSAALPVRV